MKHIITLLLALLWTTTASAEEARLNWSGYFSQSYIKTDTNNYFGPSASDSGSSQFNELGGVLSFAINDNVMAAAGGVFRNAGGTDSGQGRVDYAHLVIDHQSDNWQFRHMIGRNKLDYGFYNSTRDMPLTRQSILLPQSNYFDNAREYMINADGLSSSAKKVFPAGILETTIHIKNVNGVNNQETKRWFMGFDALGELSQDTSVGFSVDWKAETSRFKVFYGEAKVRYKPASGDFLNAGNIDVKGYWISAEKQLGTYSIVSELYGGDTQYRSFGTFMPDFDNSARGYYLEVNKWINKDIRVYARRDIMYLNNGDRNGEQFAIKTGRPASDAYAYDTTLGARWHITDMQFIAAELHNVNGTAWLPRADQPIDRQQNWNMLLLQYSIMF